MDFRLFSVEVSTMNSSLLQANQAWQTKAAISLDSPRYGLRSSLLRCLTLSLFYLSCCLNRWMLTNYCEPSHLLPMEFSWQKLDYFTYLFNVYFFCLAVLLWRGLIISLLLWFRRLNLLSWMSLFCYFSRNFPCDFPTTLWLLPTWWLLKGKAFLFRVYQLQRNRQFWDLDRTRKGSWAQLIHFS